MLIFEELCNYDVIKLKMHARGHYEQLYCLNLAPLAWLRHTFDVVNVKLSLSMQLYNTLKQ